MNINENDRNLVNYIMSDQYKTDMLEAEAWELEQMELLRKDIKEYNN